MSRIAIALSVVSFLVLAFVLATLNSVLESRPNDVYSAGVLTGRMLSDFLIGAVLSLIVWAAFRFDRHKARIPMAIWGGVVLALGLMPIANSSLGSLHASVSPPADVRARLARSTLDSCLLVMKSAKMNATQTQIENYCKCSADGMADGLSDDEVAGMSRGVPPPGLQAKTEAVAGKCLARLSQ